MHQLNVYGHDLHLAYTVITFVTCSCFGYSEIFTIMHQIICYISVFCPLIYRLKLS